MRAPGRYSGTQGGVFLASAWCVMGPQLMLIEVSLTFDEMDEPYNMSIKLSITLTTFLKLLKVSRVG